MASQKKLQFSEIKDLIIPAFFVPVEGQIKRQLNLIRNTQSAYQSYYEKLLRLEKEYNETKVINETIWLKESVGDLLEKEFPEIDTNSPEEYFEDFFKKIEAQISETKEFVVKEQSIQRFTDVDNDSIGISIQKKVKNVLFHISRLPVTLGNLFRKEKVELKFWNHKVPLKSMAHFYFKNEFLLKCLPFFEKLQASKCKALNAKWDLDRKINKAIESFLLNEEYSFTKLIKEVELILNENNIEKIEETLEKQLHDWKIECQQILKEIHETYLINFEKVGTLELNKNNYSKSKLSFGEKLITKEFLRIYNGWRNTLFAQIDDFQIDIELYSIKYSGLLQYYLTKKSCKIRIDKTIEVHFGLIQEELDKVLKPLQSKTRNNDIVKKLQAERIRVNEKLKIQIIPHAIEGLYNQNLPNIIERLGVKIQGQIDLMKENRIIYGKDNYESPISKSNLSQFNPKELIKIDLYAKFSQSIKELIKQINAQLGEIENSLVDLIGIVDYNLDSAVNSVEENKSEETIHEITLEGMERTKAKSDGIKELLYEIDGLIKGSLKESLDTFNSELIKLTVNENITELRIRLAKAKATEKTQDYKKKIILKIRNILPIILRFIRRKAAVVKTISSSYAKKIGLIEKPDSLSAELSDFLSQTEIAIEKLPYVYKRLYNIKPTDEEVFFVGREDELKKLHFAHKNWEDGNFSATAITGEKGSGSSSLVNFFTKGLGQKSYLREKLTVNYSSKDDFIDFFQTLLKNKKLDSFKEIAEELNNNQTSVIVLEDVQHFYMKKIQGFEAINLLFELISQTADNVFWLLEFTSYAWNYLEKTVGINRFFKFIIKLQKLTDNQIIDLIMKRHRVSGYNLKFTATYLTKQNKRKINSLISPEQKEKYLKTLFFKELNKFAQSNISLALLYWLRSTIKVDSNTIIIGQLKDVNFNFLSNIPAQSFFTLHSLMLHDSLSIKEHAELFNQSEMKSRLDLMVLEDQGVLNLIENRYFINRLLYRQVVNVLSKKNIIH